MPIAVLTRMLVSALALGGLIVGFGGLSDEADRLTVVSTELNFATGANLPLPQFAREVSASHSVVCRNDFRRAATAIALADLSAALDEEGRRSRLESAISAIKQQLGCSPRDGNAWLLLAVVTEPTGRRNAIYDYLNLSQRYAPLEGWIIGRRIRFVCSLVGPDVGGALDNVRRDFRALLSDRQFEAAGDLYENCRNGAERGFEEALADVDPSTRQAFVRAMARKT